LTFKSCQFKHNPLF